MINWQSLNSDWQNLINKTIIPSNQEVMMVIPENINQLIEVIETTHRQKSPLIITGNGSKLSWGGLIKPCKYLVTTQKIDRLIDHAVGDLTVTVESGMRFAELQEILAKEGQYLPLDPSYPQTATIGGIVASADTGSLRHRYGGVRDLVLGISFIRSDGLLAKAGGRVVKNVAGYDLMKLFTGSYGTLGVLTQITLRVYPKPPHRATIVIGGNHTQIHHLWRWLMGSSLTPTVVDLISSGLTNRLGHGLGMSLVVRFESILESVEAQSQQLSQVAQQQGLTSQILMGDEDSQWWHTRQEILDHDRSLTAKIGIIPAKTVELMNNYHQLNNGQNLGVIHAGTGLGNLGFTDLDGIIAMRRQCEQNSGFLSLLTAPVDIKQAIDVWGYRGNAQELMRKIKLQFDPDQIFNPHKLI